MNHELHTLIARVAVFYDPCSLTHLMRDLEEQYAEQDREARAKLAKLKAPEPQPLVPIFRIGRRVCDEDPTERPRQRGRRLAKTLNRRNRLFAELQTGDLFWHCEGYDDGLPVRDMPHLVALVYRYSGEQIDLETAGYVQAELRSAWRL